MDRRYFLSALGASSLSLSLPTASFAMGEKRDLSNYGTSQKKRRSLNKIGKRPLENVRDVFHKELFEGTIPLWKEKGVDWKNGGYLPHIDDNGTILTTNKKLYYQGRMLWLFSYFYNHFERDDFHLKAAKAGFDFLTKYCVDENFDWYTEVTREGVAITKGYDIFASIYMVLGLSEYYKATGSTEARELAVKSTYRVVELILSPTYQAYAHGPLYEPGTKRLGTWLHLLNAITPLLKYMEEPGIEKIAKMCNRYMLNFHWQPEQGYAFEILQPDFTPHPNDFFIDEAEKGFQNQARWVNNFHTMEAAWMIMDDALRVGNRGMFKAGMEFGRSHLEKYWVVRGDEQGIIQFLRPDDPDPLKGRDICKSYVFKEIFVFLMLSMEHSDESWPVDWMDRAFSYAYEKPLVWPMRDTLHQPRGVMFSLEILDRMIARNGNISSFLDSE